MLTKDYKIILASNSPRRRELLAGLGLAYEVRLVDDIDESYPENIPVAEIPLFISQKKAEAYSLAEDELLITADTIVCLDNQVLGKPKDNSEACQMLTKLSGKTHQVITGVTLTTTQWAHSFSCTSDVTFAQLTKQEIDYYVKNFHPLDKAGAYGIQEWIGYIGVTRLEGSYFNVMGLPVQRLYSELKKLNIKI
ncbi:MAG: septum formation protein Maf [Bacteroidaceae bacterium]|nr:septum formation protein Maf [Bacteroidaceae bacterium]